LIERKIRVRVKSPYPLKGMGNEMPVYLIQIAEGTYRPEKPTGLRAIIQAIVSWFKGLFGLRAEVV